MEVLPVNWRINVWAPSGEAKETIGRDDAIVSLDSFSVDGSGNCSEAEFQGVPADLWLRGRDVIQLEVDDDSGDGFVPIWMGFLLQVGPWRSRDIHTYRAVGMKQRFYERHSEIWSVPGVPPADVADAVIELFQTSFAGKPQRWTWPRNITATVQDIPQLNFQVGERFPNTETVGDTLDALAEIVGSFQVPSGESYTYEGETYFGPAHVPAVRWGVDAEGAFFFRRPQGLTHNFDERAKNILVHWRDINTEDVCDCVMFIFASETKDGWEPTPGSLAEPQPLWRRYGEVDDQEQPTGDLAVERRIVLDVPIDYMVDVVDPDSYGGTTPGGEPTIWHNEEHLADGDDGTYADLDSGEGSLFAEGGSIRGAAIIRLRVWVAEPREITIHAHSRNQVDHYGRYKIELESSLETYDFYLPILTSNPNTDNSGIYLSISHFQAGDRVYALEIYEPDDDACEQLAQAYMRGVRETPAEVELIGSVGAVAQEARILPLNENTSIDGLEVERIEYSGITDEGLLTRYFLQQPDLTEKLSERAVLDRLSRSRGRQEAAGLMKIKGAAKGH